MKFFNITKKIFLAGLFLGLVFFFSSHFASAEYTYTPMEKLPGFESAATDFPTFILNFYKFGIWAIGICALLMITVGGFLYLTSAGNTSKMDMAKKVIVDAILGLIVALAAYFILFIINPDLVNINISLNSYKGGVISTVTPTMPSGCSNSQWQSIFSSAASQTGVDKCFIQALAAKESGCSQVPVRTNGGRDCSAFQINASGVCGTSCEELETSPLKAAVCAANYMKSCSSKWRNSPTEQQIKDMYAGYNGGCGALNVSADCSGTNTYGNPWKKWDCGVNCGGYCAVPDRTSVFLSYYKQCKGS